MSVLEATGRDQINIALHKRPTLAAKIEAAAKKLETTPSEVCRDVVETFIDAYVEWALNAMEQRRRAVEAISQAARSSAPMGRISTDER